MIIALFSATLNNNNNNNNNNKQTLNLTTRIAHNQQSLDWKLSNYHKEKLIRNNILPRY